MTGTEIYKRTPGYDREAREIRLHAPHWKLLLAYDGVKSLSEVAMEAECSFGESVPLTQKFLDKGWIEEMPITLDQYLKRAGAKDISKTGAIVPPAVVLHEPGKEAVQTPPPIKPPPAVIPVQPLIVQPPVAQQPPSVAPHVPPPLPPPTPLKVPQAVAVPPPIAIPPGPPAFKRNMKLKSVVDYITSLVGNVSLGQLLVYRVFLRVPPELLLAEDVASVHLVNDTSIISGEKLQKAIGDAVNAVTKRPLPDSVFAPA